MPIGTHRKARLKAARRTKGTNKLWTLEWGLSSFAGVLLTIATTHRPATDLGHLLRKNPARAQAFDLSFGRAHVFYPAADELRCTAALLVEVDPVGLVRNRRGPSGEGGALDRYVNDRPYAASSFLSVALAEVFGSALSGQCKDRPQLVNHPIPLVATLAAIPCRGGEGFLTRLFEPLGYRVDAQRRPLDTGFPEWGESPYLRVEWRALFRSDSCWPTCMC